MSILYVFTLLIYGYMAFNVAYLIIFVIAGKLGKADDKPLLFSTPIAFRKIVVLIPAYKEDAVIVNSILTNLRQNYPPEFFDLIVIADSLKATTLSQLATLPVRVINVSFDFSTVSRAIQAALAELHDAVYDILVVSDADNHMAPDFLTRINIAFDQGWQAVQGHRVAKNTNTSVAILDAISEEINNHIFRKGNRSMGLSSSIIGSGMALDFKAMKGAMINLTTVGGFDKELEMNLLLNGYLVGYLEKALIYDEKVSRPDVFETQRTRWIAAQWQFLRLYFRQGFNEFRKGRMISASKIIQALILPKILLAGILILCFCGGSVTNQTWLWAVPATLLFSLISGLCLAIPAYLLRQLTIRELLIIPTMVLSMIKSVLNLKKAKRSFIHTPHNGVSNLMGTKI